MKQAETTRDMRQELMKVIGSGNAAWDAMGERAVLSAYPPVGLKSRIIKIAEDTGFTMTEVTNALLFIGVEHFLTKN